MKNHRHSCPFLTLRDSVFLWDKTGFSVAHVEITGYNFEDTEIGTHPGYGGSLLNYTAGGEMHMARSMHMNTMNARMGETALRGWNVGGYPELDGGQDEYISCGTEEGCG